MTPEVREKRLKAIHEGFTYFLRKKKEEEEKSREVHQIPKETP